MRIHENQVRKHIVAPGELVTKKLETGSEISEMFFFSYLDIIGLAQLHNTKKAHYNILQLFYRRAGVYGRQMS